MQHVAVCNIDNTPTLSSPEGKYFPYRASQTTVIGQDLQNAIELLRAVPSLNVWHAGPTGRLSVDENNVRHQTVDNAGTADRQEIAATSHVATHRQQATYDGSSDVTSDENTFGTTRNDDVTEMDSTADESTDDRSKYSLSWNIRKLHKHRLDSAKYSNSRPAATSGGRREKLSPVTNSFYQLGSDESLDSLVERILETSDESSMDTSRLRAALEPEVEACDERDIELTVNNSLNNFAVDKNQPNANNRQSRQVVDNTSHEESAAAVGDCRNQLDADVSGQTLEDLFEKAVECLDVDVDEDYDTGNRLETRSTGVVQEPIQQRQYHGVENTEHRVYDNELRNHCQQYRFHGHSVVNDSQYSRVSRGFALVEKVQKSSPLLKRRPENIIEEEEQKSDNKSTTDTDSRKTYRQRTVISASLAPSSGQTRQNDDNSMAEDYVRKLDMGPDFEMGATGHSIGMSRSSSVTWDTISVDSLVMVDDDSASLRAVYSATTSHQPDYIAADEDVTPTYNNKWRLSLERLNTSGQGGSLDVPDQCPGITLASESVTEATDQEQKKKDDVKTLEQLRNKERVSDSNNLSPGTNDTKRSTDGVAILSDSLTTQTLVLNVKLPKTIWNSSSTRSKSAPSPRHRQTGNVPFRELRTRREIRLSDVELSNNGDMRYLTSSETHGMTSSSDPEANNKGQLANNVLSDDVTTTTVTGDNDAVIVFTSLRPSDLMTSLPIDAEVKSENRKVTSGTEVFPNDNQAVDGEAHVHQVVGVERTNAVRELIVKGRHSCDFRYEPTSLRLLVDNVKQAFATGGATTALGGAVIGITCNAVESRSVNSCDTPTTTISDTVFGSLTDGSAVNAR